MFLGQAREGGSDLPLLKLMSLSSSSCLHHSFCILYECFRLLSPQDHCWRTVLEIITSIGTVKHFMQGDTGVLGVMGAKIELKFKWTFEKFSR